MRLLVLSFYFRPDLSAGSFRATALAEELSRCLSLEGEVHVLTTQPNRYWSFDPNAPVEEREGNVRVIRFPVPEHRSGMADQARSYLMYALSVVRTIWREREEYDLVFSTSSRLMTASLGALAARWIGAPLYLDFRDLFAENLSDVFRGRPWSVIIPPLRALEAWTVRSASRVNLVSPGFVDYFRAIRDDLEYRTFINGIDDEFLGVDYRNDGFSRNGRRIILYAGNIGEGQGLEQVVAEAAVALAPDYEFHIVGDGGRRHELEARVAELGASNVRIMDPVPREELVGLYRQADVLFVHLNSYDAFRRVLPSKIFEYAATGKPMLAGVEGVARRFIEEEVSNAAVFSPGDIAGLIEALQALELSTRSRDEFVKRFRRSDVTARMAEDILELASVRA